jgi:hypothetical protein
VRAARLALLTILLGISPSSAAGNVITLDACVGATIKKPTPKCAAVGLAPVTVLLRMRITAHLENRAIEIRTSDGSYEASIPVEGDNSDPIYLREWRIDSEGDREVAAYLVTTQGITGMARRRLTIR